MALVVLWQIFRIRVFLYSFCLGWATFCCLVGFLPTLGSFFQKIEVRCSDKLGTNFVHDTP